MFESGKLSYSAIVGTCIAALSLPLQAQEDQGAELEEIVVTGSFLYTGIDSPSPVSVLSGEDMVAYAPTRSRQLLHQQRSAELRGRYRQPDRK